MVPASESHSGRGTATTLFVEWERGTLKPVEALSLTPSSDASGAEAIADDDGRITLDKCMEMFEEVCRRPRPARHGLRDAEGDPAFF